MKRWLNTLTGRTERRIDQLGRKVLREYDDQSSKFLGLGRNSKKAKTKKHQLERLKDLKSKAKKDRRTSAGVLIGGTGIGAGTYTYHKTKDKLKSQKLKANLVDKAEKIYQKGQDDYQGKILKDPNFPLPVKIRILESQGVIKQASIKGIFSLNNIKKAKASSNDLGKEVSRLSKNKAPENLIAEADKKYSTARDKVWKERAKSYGAYGGIIGSGAYGVHKFKNRKNEG